MSETDLTRKVHSTHTIWIHVLRFYYIYIFPVLIFLFILGKTIQTIALLAHLACEKGIELIFIIEN
jgi:hypothetical protein